MGKPCCTFIIVRILSVFSSMWNCQMIFSHQFWLDFQSACRFPGPHNRNSLMSGLARALKKKNVVQWYDKSAKLIYINVLFWPLGHKQIQKVSDPFYVVLTRAVAETSTLVSNKYYEECMVKGHLFTNCLFYFSKCW